MTPKERLELANANYATLFVAHQLIVGLLADMKHEVQVAMLALLEAEDAERRASDRVQA